MFFTRSHQSNTLSDRDGSPSRRSSAPTQVVQNHPPNHHCDVLPAPSILNGEESDLTTAKQSTIGEHICIHRQTLPKVLTSLGLISEEQIEYALDKQNETGIFWFHFLEKVGLMAEQDLVSLLIAHLKIPYLNLLKYEIHESVLRLFPITIYQKYFFLPVDKLGKSLTLAMVNPLDHEALACVRQLLPGMRINLMLCSYSDFRTALAGLPSLNENKTPAKIRVYTDQCGPDMATHASKANPSSTPSTTEELSPDGSQDIANDSLSATYAYILRQIPLFKGLTEEDITKLYSGESLISYGAGEVIDTEHETDEVLFFLLNGCVKIKGRDSRVSILHRGQFFSGKRLEAEKQHHAAAVAMERTMLLAVNLDSVINRLGAKSSIQLLTNIACTLR